MAANETTSYDRLALRLLLMLLTLAATLTLWLAVGRHASGAALTIPDPVIDPAAGAIGGTLWDDANEDGVLDPGEKPLAGVGVSLLGDSTPASMVTGADGSYAFEDLAGGTYTVTVDADALAGGSTPTFDVDGVETPHRATVILAPATSETGVDFGYIQAFQVEKRHWLSNRQPSYSQRYSIDISNSSAITLTDILVTDLLPDMLRFSHTNAADGTPTGGNYDPATHQIHQDLVVHVVEVTENVGFHHMPAPEQRLSHRLHGLPRTTLGTISIRTRQEARLEQRLDDDLTRLLGNPIANTRNAQRAQTPIRLGNLHPKHRQPAIPPSPQIRRELLQIGLRTMTLDLLKAHAIDPGATPIRSHL